MFTIKGDDVLWIQCPAAPLQRYEGRRARRRQDCKLERGPRAREMAPRIFAMMSGCNVVRSEAYGVLFPTVKQVKRQIAGWVHFCSVTWADYFGNL